MFLWKEKTRRQGKDSFKELLKLVAKRQNNDEEEASSTSTSGDVPVSKVMDCLFCGAGFSSLRLKATHMKVRHQFQPGESSPLSILFRSALRGLWTSITACSASPPSLPAVARSPTSTTAPRSRSRARLVVLI